MSDEDTDPAEALAAAATNARYSMRNLCPCREEAPCDFRLCEDRRKLEAALAAFDAARPVREAERSLLDAAVDYRQHPRSTTLDTLTLRAEMLIAAREGRP